jgi:hypothetical protein
LRTSVASFDGADTYAASTDQLALLTLIHILEREKVEVPYKELNLHINGGANWSDREGGPVGQHLTKVRKARVYLGMPVPPPKKSARNSNMDTPKIPSEKEIKTYHSLTYTRPGSEDKMDGVPGTMQARYTPVPITDRPDLPIYDPTYHPPMWPLPDEFEYLSYDVRSKTPRTSLTWGKKQGKKQGKVTRSSVDEINDAPVASTEKKCRSTKVVQTKEDDDDQYSAEPTHKAQNKSAGYKRKTAAEQAAELTPAKPKGVPKSRKTPAAQRRTPATVTKKLSEMLVNPSDGKLDLTVTPSKKAGGIKKKETSNVAAETEQVLTTGCTPVANSEAEQPAQNYGRVNMDAASMMAQSFGEIHAGLPPNGFQMGKYRASQRKHSQSTMSTADNPWLHMTSAQFMPSIFQHSQSNYAGNGYGHQMMSPQPSSSTQGHNMQDMSKEELIQRILRGEEEEAAHHMQQYNNSRRQIHKSARGHDSYGLSIATAPAMMPRQYAQFYTGRSNCSFASGSAIDLSSQQQYLTNDLAHMQNDSNRLVEIQNEDNDRKPNMEHYSGGFNAIPDFDASMFDRHQ